MKKAAIVIFGIFIIFFVGIIYISRFRHVSVSLFAKEFKIGMILCGNHEDDGLSRAHFSSVLKVAKEKDIVLEFFENVPYDERCKEKIEELIKDRCSLIILDSGDYNRFSRRAAFEHPEVYFLNAFGVEGGNNYVSFSARMYQPNYLTGIVAGLQTDNNRIGYITPARDYELISDINAFTLGVKKVNPEAMVYVGYPDSSNGVTTVSRLIDEVGVDVLMDNTYSNHSLKAADKKGVWIIGCHTDQSKAYPETYLTAVVWNFDNFYKTQINNCINGMFHGQAVRMGINDMTVDIAPLTDNVKPGISETVMNEREKLINREYDVFYGPIYDNKGKLRARVQESIPDRVLFSKIDWFVPGVVKYE